MAEEMKKYIIFMNKFVKELKKRMAPLKAEGIAQWTKCLHYMHEDLSSDPLNLNKSQTSSMHL